MRTVQRPFRRFPTTMTRRRGGTGFSSRLAFMSTVLPSPAA